MKLEAIATDPDGNKLTAKWWQYADADSAVATVAIANADSLDKASFVAPERTRQTVQIILEVTDNGTPVVDWLSARHLQYQVSDCEDQIL